MKVIKALVVLVIVLALVVIGGIAAFVTLVDPNDFKGQVVAKVREQTGRELSLEGPLEWAFWPKIKLRAGPLSLSNAEGFGPEPFLVAYQIDFAVATWPLLSKRVEMDTIVLHGVVLNLARNEAGLTNWQDLAGDGSEKSDSGGLSALILGGVDIKDARLTWSDAVSGQKATISKLNVGTGPLTFGEPVDFKLSLTAQSNKPALDSDIELTGTVAYTVDEEHYVISPLVLGALLRGPQLPGGSAKIDAGAAIDLNLKQQTANISGLELSGLGTTVEGQFDATGLDEEKPSAAGVLNIAGKDLAQVFNAFQLPVGKQLTGVADRSFNFSTVFDANMTTGEVQVSKFEGNMLGARLNGGFNASKANTDEPVAKGQLSAKGPDLPSLIAVLAQLQGANAATLKNLNQALAGARDKSFAISADLDADMGAGRVSLPNLKASLLGNTIAGEVLATNADSDKPAVKGSLKAQGPDFPALLAVASQFQADGKGLSKMAKTLAAEKDKSFKIEAVFDTDLGAGRLEVPTLSGDLLGLSIRGGVKGEGVDFAKNSGKLNGKLSIDSKDLGPLLRGMDQADLAQSLRTLRLDAGLAGSMSDLSLSPLTLVATVINRDVPKPVELKVSAGSARANLDQETLTLDDLTVTGLGLNAKADLDAEKILSAPTYHGKLDVPAFNLRTLLSTLNKPVPKTADPKALTSLGLATDFSGTPTGIKLDNLKIALDQTTIKGNVDIMSFEGPSLAFGIGIDAINADRYLEPKPAGKGTAVTPEAAAAGAASELPVETLRALQIKGDLTVGDLVLSGAKMKNIKVAINANGGKIRVDPLGAQLYDGNYGGVINLDATGQQAVLDLNTQLNNVNVEPLLKDTVNNDSLAGVVSFDAALKATGGSPERIKQSLSGNGRFGTKNGVFRGVDAIAILRAVEQIIECKCPVPVPKGGETRFTTLGGTLNAQNGVIRNEDLVLSGDGFNITGKGMLANLHDNSLKYDLKLNVTEARASTGQDSFNLGGYGVPIQCRGSIEKPSCLPDLGGILAEVATSAAKKEIEKAVGDQLDDVLPGEAGEAIKNLLKF